MKCSSLAAFLLVSLAFDHASLAQGVIVRPNDGVESRCVNGKKDEIWLTLRRLVTTKTKGWFTEAKSVAVVAKTTVRVVSVPPSASDKPLTFPLMTEGSFGAARPGQVSVPLEYTIIDSLKLESDKKRYSGVGIDLILMNKDKKNTWGSALATLGKVAAKVPLPTNPATQGATYLLQLANDAVDADVNAQTDENAARTASITLNFDPTGSNCSAANDFQRTGTVALLMDGGNAGYIPSADASKYCWSADLQPVFILKAGKKHDPDASESICTTANSHEPYMQVNNNYVGFVLSAIPASADLAGPPTADVEAARRRCEKNGLAASACSAAKH